MNIKFLVKFSVSFVLIFYLFVYKIDLKGILDVYGQINHIYLSIAFFLVILGVALSSYKWKLLLNCKEVNIPIFKLFSLYLKGMFVNNFFVSFIGGDFYKVKSLMKDNDEITILNSVLLERLLGLLGLIILVAMSSSYWEIRIFITTLFLMVVMALFAAYNSYFFNILFRALLLFKLQYIGDRLKKLQTSLYSYGENKKTILLSVLISLSFHVNSVLVAFFVSVSLRIDVPFSFLLIAVPLISFFSMLPISVQGVGIREFGYIYAFSIVNISTVEAASQSLLVFSLLVSISLIGGGLLLIQD